MLEIAPSSCRPPWFETTMPLAPLLEGNRASSGWRMPFTMIGNEVRERNQGIISQREACCLHSLRGDGTPSCDMGILPLETCG